MSTPTPRCTLTGQHPYAGQSGRMFRDTTGQVSGLAHEGRRLILVRLDNGAMMLVPPDQLQMDRSHPKGEDTNLFAT